MKAIYYIGRLLRIVVIDDPGLKLICLALAVLMWFYIDGELMSQKEFELPMKASDIATSDGLELAAPNALPIFKVAVRGPRRQIEFWGRENLRFKRKLLDNPRPGANPINVNVSDVEAENFAVVSIEPVTPGGATVSFVATETTMKSVRVLTRNQPKSLYLVGQPTVVPTQVRVKGSKDDLAAIEEVWTEEVDLGAAERDVDLEVPIKEKMDIGGRVIAIKCAEKVRVNVPIDPKKVIRAQTFDVWARVPSGLAMKVEPQSVEVEVVIEERDYALLPKISLYVEWPGTWERPKDTTVLGPTAVQVKVSGPPRVVVRGVNNGPLPTVNVMGALSGGLK